MTEAEWLACEDPAKMLEFLRGKAGERKLRLFIADCCRRVHNLLPNDLLRDAAGRQAVAVAELLAESPSDAGEYCAAFTAVQMAADCELRLHEEPILASTLRRPLPALLVLAVALRPKNDVTGHLWNAVAHQDVVGGEEETDLVQQAIGSGRYAADALTENALETRIANRGLLERLFNLRPQADDSLVEQCRTDEIRRQIGLLHCIFGNPFRPATLDPARRTATVTSLAQAIYNERAFDRLPILADALEDAGCTSADVLSHCRSGGEHVRGCWVVDLVLGKE